MSLAALRASSAWVKTAKKPSPSVRTSTPWWAVRRSRMMSAWCSITSRNAANASLCSRPVESSTSLKKNVTVPVGSHLTLQPDLYSVDFAEDNLFGLPAGPRDVLLACTDGLWSGLSEQDVAAIAVPGANNIGENLKALSIKALNVNSPYSDNTTGTALRWLSD